MLPDKRKEQKDIKLREEKQGYHHLRECTRADRERVDLTRKYNGYELGIYFFIDGQTGETIITSIWKRERR